MRFEGLNSPAAPLNESMRQAAIERQTQLTKPPGALGVLEDIVIQLAAMQGQLKPEIRKIHIAIFAADHGVAVNGVSAFPQAVTSEMIKNFANGGAAISVLARTLNAKLEVINLGTVLDFGSVPQVIDQRIAAGTKDFSQESAMSNEELKQALKVGQQAAERAMTNKANLFIGGDMGIGNTTAATAIACAILNKSPAEMTGRGTGLDDDGLRRKISLLNDALSKHKRAHQDPFDVLGTYGGFEIAALVGSYIACAKMGLPVLVDGFIATSAALCAVRLCDNAANWFFYAHTSAEPGHLIMLKDLQATPLLDLRMRLGEGSGAAIAVPLLQFACELHNNMATFAEASVSKKTE